MNDPLFSEIIADIGFYVSSLRIEFCEIYLRGHLLKVKTFVTQLHIHLGIFIAGIGLGIFMYN